MDRDSSSYSTSISLFNQQGEKSVIKNTHDFIVENISSKLKEYYFFLDTVNKQLLDLFDCSSKIAVLDIPDDREQISELLKYTLLSLSNTFLEKKNSNTLKGSITLKGLKNSSDISFFGFKTLLYNEKTVDYFLSSSNFLYEKYILSSPYCFDLIYTLFLDDKVSVSFPLDLLYSGFSNYEDIIKLGYYISGIKLTLDSSYIINKTDYNVDLRDLKRINKYINDSVYDSPCFYPNLENKHISDTEIYNIPYEPGIISPAYVYKNRLKADIVSYFERFNNCVIDYQGNDVLEKLLSQQLLSDDFFSNSNISKKSFLTYISKYCERLFKSPEIISKDIDLLTNAMFNNIYTSNPELIVTEDSKIKTMAYMIKDFLSLTNYTHSSGVQDTSLVNLGNKKNINNNHWINNFNQQRYGKKIINSTLFNILLSNTSKGSCKYHEISL